MTPVKLDLIYIYIYIYFFFKLLFYIKAFSQSQSIVYNVNEEEKNLRAVAMLFTEAAPGLVQSILCDVHLCVTSIAFMCLGECKLLSKKLKTLTFSHIARFGGCFR